MNHVVFLGSLKLQTSRNFAETTRIVNQTKQNNQSVSVLNSVKKNKYITVLTR